MVKLFTTFLACFVLGTAHAETRPTPLQVEGIRQVIGQQLAQQPDNRNLRFKYAQASYQSDHYAAAKYHLNLLMRSSNSPDDLRKLKTAYATVAADSAWSADFNFSILPSTNINKTSSNRILITPLGTFLIDGGGVEESGVGMRVGGSLNYEQVLSSGASLTYGLELNRRHYPAERLNSFDGTVSLTWEQRSLSGLTKITPYISRHVFDTSLENNSDSTRYGLRLSYQYYLTNSNSITGAVSVSHQDYDNLDSLDGNLLRASLSYEGTVWEEYGLNTILSVSHNAPEQENLRYVGVSLRGELTRAIGTFGTAGINAELGARQYQGEFFLLGDARKGRFASIGASFRSPHIRVFNTSPKVSCRFHRNWSNVALYDFQSTDCAITFKRNF